VFYRITFHYWPFKIDFWTLQTYIDKLAADKFDYDTWFDFIRLEEAEEDNGGNSNAEKVRAVYRQAVANVPPVKEKRCLLLPLSIFLIIVCH